MRVTFNPDWTTEQIRKFEETLVDNGGYCPCLTTKTPDTKCMCRDFREKLMDETFYGECHCGYYCKAKESEVI